MKEDKRICEGNYDSAMHYDCAICGEKCSLRKEKIKITDLLLLLFPIIVIILIIIKAIGVL